MRLWAFGTLQSEPQPCVATFLVFLQDSCPALALSSHFCRKTALRSRFPRISKENCPTLPLPCASTVLHGL